MSWDINKVIVVGRLSADVELKYTPSGTAVARFGLAVGGKPKTDGSDSVSFFIVVWGKSAENCSNYLSKGKQVALDGRLEQRSWVTQDGSKRSVVEIIADRVEFLGSPSGAKSALQASSREPAQAAKPVADATPFEDNFYDNTDFNPAPVEPPAGESPDIGGEEPNF
jgi:single-strand DNA-binding protein